MNNANVGYPEVTVVLAVFRPEPEFLRTQIKSLQEQTHPISRLVVVIADRLSTDFVREISDPHSWELDVVLPDTETDSYKSFELGLRRAVELSHQSALFALCDQDDVWHPTKVEASVAVLENNKASLVHCDARVIDHAGDLQHTSLYRLEKRVLNSDPRQLLLRNSVTGMTAMFTHDVAKASLPFPTQASLFFHHDLWLALVASVLNGVRAVQTPLVDYRKHLGNVVGPVSGKSTTPRIFSKPWARHWAGSYSVASYLAKCLYLRMQEVSASKTGRPDQEQLLRLAPYLNRTPTGGRLVLDGLWSFFRARVWFARQSAMFGAVQAARLVWALRRCLKAGAMDALSAYDAKSFAIAPGAQPGHVEVKNASSTELWSAASLRDDRTVRRFDIDVVAHLGGRIVILVPSLNPSEIFAGIATAIDIGVGLAAQGHPVVFVATDLPMESHARSQAFIKQRSEAFSKSQTSDIDLFCGVTGPILKVSRDDRFVATAWWSAHVVDAIICDGDLTMRQFFYLIQDFEPGFYPWGAEYAGALASYSLDFVPIYNTHSLLDYMNSQSLVQNADRSFVFHPSIDIQKFARLSRKSNRTRKLVVYGRPEVPRNLFSVAGAGLEKFLSDQAIIPAEIDLVSIGLKHPDVILAGGHRLRSLGKIPWDDYPKFLASVDVGLSLMLSPHPSHPPLEMAAAGSPVVTNSFVAKDLDQLAPHILSVSATADDVGDALGRAWAIPAVSDHDRMIDLSPLGQKLEEMLVELSDYIIDTSPVLAKAG